MLRCEVPTSRERVGWPPATEFVKGTSLAGGHLPEGTLLGTGKEVTHAAVLLKIGPHGLFQSTAGETLDLLELVDAKYQLSLALCGHPFRQGQYFLLKGKDAALRDSWHSIAPV